MTDIEATRDTMISIIVMITETEAMTAGHRLTMTIGEDASNILTIFKGES